MVSGFYGIWILHLVAPLRPVRTLPRALLDLDNTLLEQIQGALRPHPLDARRADLVGQGGVCCGCVRMAKIVDLGQAVLPDHGSGAIWGSKTLDPGRSREKRWIRGLPIFFDPSCGPKPYFLTLHCGALWEQLLKM